MQCSSQYLIEALKFSYWVIPYQIIRPKDILKPSFPDLANFFTTDTRPYEGLKLEISLQNIL